MIFRFEQKTALVTVLIILLTILVGCSARANVKPFDVNNTNDHNQPPAQNVVTLQSEKKATVKVSDSPSIDLPLAVALPEDLTVEEKVEFYLDKLKDKEFTGTYGDGYTWYTAAEELGMIGKPAIPGLIKKLDTQDDYERALALYALLLASQQENVKSFSKGEYIDVNLDFNKDNHTEMVDKAMAWWDKYKDNF